MLASTDIILLIIKIFKEIFVVVFIAFMGFGPGFLLGMLLANRIVGRGFPMKFETHMENGRKAGEHNKQWHPDSEKWKE